MLQPVKSRYKTVLTGFCRKFFLYPEAPASRASNVLFYATSLLASLFLLLNSSSGALPHTLLPFRTPKGKRKGHRAASPLFPFNSTFYDCTSSCTVLFSAIELLKTRSLVLSLPVSIRTVSSLTESTRPIIPPVVTTSSAT